MTVRRCAVCSCPLTIFEVTDYCVDHRAEAMAAHQAAPPIVATGVAAPSAQCGRCGSWVEPEAIVAGRGCLDCQPDTLEQVLPLLGSTPAFEVVS